MAGQSPFKGIRNISSVTVGNNASVDTGIKTPEWNNPKAYLYLASGFSSGSMNNSYEFGILRVGYEGTLVEKIELSKGGVVYFPITFTASDGKVFVYCGRSSLSNNLILIG